MSREIVPPYAGSPRYFKDMLGEPDKKVVFKGPEAPKKEEPFELNPEEAVEKLKNGLKQIPALEGAALNRAMDIINDVIARRDAWFRKTSVEGLVEP